MNVLEMLWPPLLLLPPNLFTS